MSLLNENESADVEGFKKYLKDFITVNKIQEISDAVHRGDKNVDRIYEFVDVLRMVVDSIFSHRLRLRSSILNIINCVILIEEYRSLYTVDESEYYLFRDKYIDENKVIHMDDDE